MIHRERGKELERELRAHLEPGEKLLWSGQPQAGLILRVGELFAIPFMFVWGGGLLTVGVLALDALLLHPEKIAPGGLPLVLVIMPVAFVFGFYVLIGRFLLDDRLQKKTLYAITDRRFLILSGLWWRFCRVRALNEISVVFRREDCHGRTTIWLDSWPLLQLLRRRFSFGPAPSAVDLQAFPVPRISGLYSIRFGWFGFELIEDGDDVAALIKDAHEKARS